ncbi:MAG: hypothetical protein ACLPY1_11285 [Terracidiphilus sp.]
MQCAAPPPSGRTSTRLRGDLSGSTASNPHAGTCFSGFVRMERHAGGAEWNQDHLHDSAIDLDHFVES